MLQTKHITNIADFALAVATLAVEFDLSVTSWYRSHKRNKSVGGVENSLHLCGLAVDIVLDNDSDKESFIKRAQRFGLRIIDEGHHLHIQVN